MGFISRKIFPACGNMCVCCPALRSRSRQPVKRYKKLLADIFPKTKSRDATPNDRKISKLCEYAAKNPIRIPKIAKYLEERCYKELRHDHIKIVNIITEAYKKMLCTCKQQMVYFGFSLLNVVNELLDNSKQDAVKILGCQTLTRFIYSQVDGTYTHNIEKFVDKVCKLARIDGEEQQRRSLRAASLQCLSAMVWFMTEFSCVFAAFDEVVQATLDNFTVDIHGENDDERGDHNWVDEVVRCEGRGAIVGSDTIPSCITVRPRFEKKDPSLLTREEIETPKVWAQICIQRMVELGKESTTMRTVLEPMFVYFDLRQQWEPGQGLAMVVLCDMCYLTVASGNQHIILAAVIRHLDHKNVSHDPKQKSFISQVAAVLAKQIRSGAVLSDISSVGDLCRHLRKSLQATLESAGEQDLTLNILLQNAIEDCLLEIAKGIGDAKPLFDLMAITLEKVPSSGVVARATIGSLMILAQIISLILISPPSHQVFPEALLDQLLKVMLHPNVEVRVEAHQTFSILLLPNSSRYGLASSWSSYANEPRRWRSNTACAFASISALLEKLRREKDGPQACKNVYNAHDDIKVKDTVEEDRKQGHTCKSSPNLCDLSSIIDRTAGLNITETELYMLKLTEDQILQLLSAFWLQATLPDNLPSNIEAISHSFMLTLISLRLKNPNDNIVVRCFQLPWSLINISLDLNNGMLTPTCRRSIFLLSLGMLMIASKIFHVPALMDPLKSLVSYNEDPFLGICDDLQIFVRPQAEVRDYGSVSDNQLASSLLLELRDKVYESNMALRDVMVQNLCTITKLEADVILMQLSEAFSPDDALLLGPQAVLDLELKKKGGQSKGSLSFDEEIPTSSLIEDDARSETSVTDLSRFIPKVPPSSLSHVMSIGKLLESALTVAGQVAATSVSTSPLPYDSMASQCEALGTGTRKKLSNWLAYENHQSRASDTSSPGAPSDRCLALWEITSDAAPVKGGWPADRCLAMRLPPASPFDNFLKAAGC